MKRSKLMRLRALIEAAAESLDDKAAMEGVELYPVWEAEKTYRTGQRVRWGSTLYRCLMDHDAQADWTPTAAPSLWARVLIEDPNTVPEWVQSDSTNPYMKGERVSYLGKIWISLVDHNTWEPGVYGWEEAA